MYALLIEHATQEQIDDINKTLDADVDAGNPDDFAALLQQAITEDE